MGRGRVQLKRIENTINRQVTFSKRRAGLLKKANEISVMCDAEVALIIFSTKGKVSEYSTDSRMEGILERYERYSYAEKAVMISDPEPQESWYNKYGRLKAKVEALQSSQRHLMGEQLDMLSLKELQQLEQQLEHALKNTRSRKEQYLSFVEYKINEGKATFSLRSHSSNPNQLLLDSISDLEKKEAALIDQNRALEKKLIEKEKAKPLAKQGHWEQQGQQQYTESSPPSFVIQDPLPTLNMGINPASASSEEDNTARPPAPINSSNLPQWMILAHQQQQPAPMDDSLR